MECKKCGKKIDDVEIYCSDCKDLLKKEKELDKLIEKNKELNKLEITKEVENLKNFKDEKKESSSTLKEELQGLVNIGEEEFELKDGNKILVIVTILILAIILILGIIFIPRFLKKNDEEEVNEPIVPNYEKIIKNYGDSVKLAVSKNLESNKEIPSWSVISEMVEYSENDVICSVHDIYIDGNIYLDNCKVNGKRVKYSYGEKREEIKEGKKIEIYQILDENNNYLYSVTKSEESELIGTITCKTEECEYKNVYEKYVLVSENDEYYIYNYETNSMEFGPFNEINNSYENNILTYNNELYGILYEENSIKNIYNINTEKTIKNLKGDLLASSMYLNPSLLYKYGYIILKDGNDNNFVNLKTGNISYTINGTLNTFIEDKINKLVYITTVNSQNDKITIYNSNGKKLFSGNEYNEIFLIDSGLIISNDNNFYVYDSKLKLKLTSKEYNNILGLYNDFVVVVNNEYLEVVDLKDNIIVTFDLKWNNIYHSFDKLLSGYSKNNEIKLVVEDKIKHKYLEYSYNIDTKELSNVEKNKDL